MARFLGTITRITMIVASAASASPAHTWSVAAAIAPRR